MESVILRLTDDDIKERCPKLYKGLTEKEIDSVAWKTYCDLAEQNGFWEYVFEALNEAIVVVLKERISP